MKRKIIILSQGLSNGGSERVSSILANYLINKGYQVLFIAVYNNIKSYNLDDKIDYKYIEVSSKFKIIRFLKRCITIRKIINEFKPDCTFSFICNDTLFVKNKGKIVYTLRNDPKRSERNIFTRKLRDYIFSKGKSVVFQTPDALNYFSKKIRKKGIIIMNPINTECLPKWEKNKHNNRIVTACRINKQKNIPMLIEAFECVSKTNDNIILEIYGEGEEKQMILDLIKKKKLEERIKLMGYSNDIHQIMATSKVFVLSSDYEGLSNSMLEALCIGIPCVCTDCPPGGASMMIKENENGFLTKVNDYHEFSKKIIKLLNNESLCRKFNSNNKKYREELKIDKICEKWESLI